MAQYNATALVVDDRDPRIVYSPGWQQVQTSAEYDYTKSGAANAGMTATFQFIGTGVEVYGAIGSFDVYGQPVSTYKLDGFASSTTTYQAPVIPPPYYTSRALFYRSPSLSPGSHTLVITNINDTKPCIYWLDYILYTPSDDEDPPSSSPSSLSSPTSPPPTPPPHSPPLQPLPSTFPSSQKSLPSSAFTGSTHSGSNQQPSLGEVTQTTSSSSMASIALSGTSQSAAPTTIGPSSNVAATSVGPPGSLNSDTSSPGAVARRVPAGAIAGGVVGGVILAVALAALLFWCRRRRNASTSGITEEFAPTPFRYWRNNQPMPIMQEKNALQSRAPTLSAAVQQETPSNPFLDVTPFASVPTASPSLQPVRVGASSTSPLRVHEDSGQRFRQASAIDIPPVYTES